MILEIPKLEIKINHAYAVFQHNTVEKNRAEYKKAKESLEDVYNLVVNGNDMFSYSLTTMMCFLTKE